MPRLPDMETLGARPVPVSRRQIASNPAAGVVGRAVEGFGDTVAQIGTQKLDAQDRLSFAAAKSAYQAADIQARNALQDDPDYTTYKDRYTEQMKTAQASAAGMIRNKSDRSLFEMSVGEDFQRGLGQVQLAAHAKGVTAGKAVLSQTLENTRNAGRDALDEATRAAALNTANEAIAGAQKSGLIDPLEATNIRQSFASDYTVQQTQLALNRDDPDGAAAILKQSGDMIDWKQRLALEERVQGVADRREAVAGVNGIMGMATQEGGATVSYADPLRGKGRPPVPGGQFGASRDYGQHHGVDSPAPVGTPVYAAGRGVAHISKSPLGGNIVTVTEGAAPSSVMGYPVVTNPNTSRWDRRADGSKKGMGWLGLLQRPDGKVSSEISAGIEIDGKEMEVPLMVPGLTKPELDYLMTTPVDGGAFMRNMPHSILQKAQDHAEAMIAAGKSPFRQGDAAPPASSARTWKFMHLGAVNVKDGDTVTPDTVLGAVGTTGRTTGPHLHYEVWQDGKPVDPKTVIGQAQQSPQRHDLNQIYAQIDQQAAAEGWTPEKTERWKEEADRRVSRDETLANRQDKASMRSALDTVDTLGDKFTDVSQIPNFHSLAPDDRLQLDRIAKANAKQGDVPENSDTAIYLKRLAAEKPEEFKALDLRKYRPFISLGEFSSLSVDQGRELAKPPGSPPLDNIRSEIDTAIKFYGKNIIPDDVASRKDPAAMQQYGRISDVMRAYLDRATDGGKRKPTDDEFKAAFDSATMQVIVHNQGLFGGDRTKMRYELPVGQHGVAIPIPNDVRNRIMGSLVKHGQEPSDEAIATIYMQNKGRPGFWQ